MKNSFLKNGPAAIAFVALLPAEAMAQPQLMGGSEIVGQPIQVTTNGTTNTIYLDAGGQLRILTPNGNTVRGAWTAANGQLCLNVGVTQECVPYSRPFQAGSPQTLTSSCGATETWLAENTNQPPTEGQKGERGR